MQYLGPGKRKEYMRKLGYTLRHCCFSSIPPRVRYTGMAPDFWAATSSKPGSDHHRAVVFTPAISRDITQ